MSHSLSLDSPSPGSLAVLWPLPLSTTPRLVIPLSGQTLPAWTCPQPARARSPLPSCWVNTDHCLARLLWWHQEEGTRGQAQVSREGQLAAALISPLQSDLGCRGTGRKPPVPDAALLLGLGGCMARATEEPLRNYTSRAATRVLQGLPSGLVSSSLGRVQAWGERPMLT